MSIIPASQVKKRTAKGWYDSKTDKVVVVLPNNTSIADIQAQYYMRLLPIKD